MNSLTDTDFQRAANILGCEIAAIKAVCEVEAPRGGFDADGDVITLLEGHKFSAFTGGVYDKQYPNISYPKWTTRFYGKTRTAEKERLRVARSLNESAAIRATSWGRFQVMGFNYRAAGFTTLPAFVAAMESGEGAQLDAFVTFILTNHLADELRLHDWAGFARQYNGPDFEANHYDTKMATAYAKYAGGA